MRRFVFALLGGLVLIPLPLHAQGTVTLSVCNAGKVPVDVFLSQSGKVFGSSVGPADCAAVAKTSGAMQPAYVGFAFADAKGQWGAARRFTTVSSLSPADQTAQIRRGSANVTLPMPWLFSPRVPGCVSTGTTVPDNGRVFVGGTFCDQLRYTLNVDAYAETREIAFVAECDACDQKANPQLTPRERAIKQSQRAAVDLRDARVSSANPNQMGILNRNTTVVDVEEVATLLSRHAPPQRVNQTDLVASLRSWRATRAADRPWMFDVIPRNIVTRGTVSSVDVSPVSVDANNTVPMVNVAFRESPGTEFNICTTRLDILQDLFGADFRTSMIGKPIEVEGQIGGGGGPGSCRGVMTSLRIELARQVRPVQSAQFPAGTRVWVQPPPVEDDYDLVLAAWEKFVKVLEQKHRQALAACPQQSAAPQQFFLCRDRIFAPERAQKQAACVVPYERAAKENPGDRPTLQPQFRACMDRP